MARPVSWYSFRSTHQKRALIFVHGYNGNPRESWCAFARLLLADERLADWDILSFGYGIRSSILGAAASLTSQISQPEMSGYTELAFVTHNIGGLIVQRALVDNNELAGRVRLAFFFASPNAGIRLPRLFRIPWLSHIASPLDELSPGSPLLQELNQRWNQKFGLKTPFEYWSIAADRDAFVSAVSLSAVPLEHRLVVSADHLSLIRPETPQAGGFRVVTEALMYRDVPATAKKAAQGSVAVEEKREAGISDVFLHCNHVDTEVVLEVAQQLRAAGFEPWLVVEKATTGKPWNESLMRDIDRMKAVAICIGKEGPRWRDREQAAVAGEFARRGCSVIPVYLTSCPHNAGDVIEDLNVYPVVDFRQPGTEPLEHLIEGISGRRPTKVTQAFTKPKESLNVVVTEQSRHRVVSRIMTSAAILLAVVVIAIKIVNRGVVIPGNPSIKAVYLGEGPHTKPVVVVFVHGIFGDKSTWGEQKTSFPEMLVSDPSFDGKVDVFQFEYYSPRFGPASNVSELAKQLKSALEDNHVLQDHDRVAFLVHSMGGLVTRRCLILLHDLKKVSMIYFYATPTNGADIADIAGRISSSPQLKSMLPLEGNEALQQIEDDWLNRPELRTLPSYCSYETLPTDGIYVVTQASARALCNRLPEGMTANHIQIVKPSSRADPRYSRFATALKETAFGISDRAEGPQPSNPTPIAGANSGQGRR